MASTKRKRAVVLALIAFFCGATAYVGVDWKRFGGGFLAFFKHKGDPVVATGGAAPSGSQAQAPLSVTHPAPGPNLSVATAGSHRHTSSVGGGSGGRGGDEDLFKYGDPAAGIPAGSFVVAQNDTPAGGGGSGGAAPETPSLGAPSIAEAAASPLSGDAGGSGGGAGGGVSSPAPAPAGGGGSGDSGVIVKSPTPPAPPASPAPPSSPAPAPTQSGSGDQNNGGGDPTGGGTTPVSPVPPASAVPEASTAAMMGLGALFLAVAATRQRKGRQA